MKIVINPTWNCQLKCAYCWLPHTKINRAAQEHDWHDWASSLGNVLPPGSIVDVAGGEPLLYAGLSKLLLWLGTIGIHWALTTNALDTVAVDTLTRSPIPGCIQFNVSDHKGNAAAHDNINRLRVVYPVVVHRVNHPAAGNHEGGAGIIQYQEWKEGRGCDGIPRICNAGVYHWVIDPGGDVFRCCVDMQVANTPMFNLFDGSKPKQSMAQFCDFGCSSCYTSEPYAWQINMRPA